MLSSNGVGDETPLFSNACWQPTSVCGSWNAWVPIPIYYRRCAYYSQLHTVWITFFNYNCNVFSCPIQTLKSSRPSPPYLPMVINPWSSKRRSLTWSHVHVRYTHIRCNLESQVLAVGLDILNQGRNVSGSYSGFAGRTRWFNCQEPKDWAICRTAAWGIPEFTLPLARCSLALRHPVERDGQLSGMPMQTQMSTQRDAPSCLTNIRPDLGLLGQTHTIKSGCELHGVNSFHHCQVWDFCVCATKFRVETCGFGFYIRSTKSNRLIFCIYFFAGDR